MEVIDKFPDESKYYRDVFLSHANVDKEKYVRPLVELLEQREITYWLDEAEIRWGGSLLDQISQGLLKSRYVLFFLSDSFLGRPWPEAELRTALNKEISSGEIRVLPIMLCDVEKCLERHPFLRDKKWITWEIGINAIINQLELLIGRSFSQEWEFLHPAKFRGHVWIKIMPKSENVNKPHKFTIAWGRWEYSGKVQFKSNSAAILDFKKIAEEDTWPIHFRISPPAFVVSGRGNPVVDINKGWKCKDRKGLGQAIIQRKMQSLLPDTEQ